MVMRVLIGAALAATAAGTCLGVNAVRAADVCCAAPPFPQVVYASPPAFFVVPPTGYVLNPSDAVRPFYVVTQVPYATGFGIVPLARPTYSEGGYAYADSYPYAAPYIHSYGFGVRTGYRAWRAGPVRSYFGDAFDRRAGAPPYTAYRYRTAPSARIIQIPQDD